MSSCSLYFVIETQPSDRAGRRCRFQPFSSKRQFEITGEKRVSTNLDWESISYMQQQESTSAQEQDAEMPFSGILSACAYKAAAFPSQKTTLDHPPTRQSGSTEQTPFSYTNNVNSVFPVAPRCALQRPSICVCFSLLQRRHGGLGSTTVQDVPLLSMSMVLLFTISEAFSCTFLCSGV